MRACPRCHSLYADGDRQFCGIDGTRLEVRDTDPLIGTRLGDSYDVIEAIGSGGMGCVYRARRAGLGNEYAIKVMYGHMACDPVVSKRFRREAQAASEINHPNVVRIVEVGITDSGLMFIVMELLVGRCLAEVIRDEGQLPASRAAQISAQVAAGLGAAHTLGFVHRDLKPANVFLVDASNGDERVKLLDFGVVGLVQDTSDRLTRPGHVVGTPMYMAPEQVSDAAVAPSADLYALGAILYEMLAGRPPFLGASMVDVFQKQLTQSPDPLQPAGGLEAIALSLLEKEPGDRPPNAQSVIDQIEALKLVPWRAPPHNFNADGLTSPGISAYELAEAPAAVSYDPPPRETMTPVVLVEAAASDGDNATLLVPSAFAHSEREFSKTLRLEMPRRGPVAGGSKMPRWVPAIGALGLAMLFLLMALPGKPRSPEIPLPAPTPAAASGPLSGTAPVAAQARAEPRERAEPELLAVQSPSPPPPQPRSAPSVASAPPVRRREARTTETKPEPRERAEPKPKADKPDPPKRGPQSQAEADFERALAVRGLDRSDLKDITPGLEKQLKADDRDPQLLGKITEAVNKADIGVEVLERKLNRARRALDDSKKRISDSEFRRLDGLYQTIAEGLALGKVNSTASAIRIKYLSDQIRAAR